MLDQHTELKRLAEAKKVSAAEKQRREEQKILESVAERTALMGVAELAKGFYSFLCIFILIIYFLMQSTFLGIQYEEPIKTSWKPPKCVLAQPQSRSERIRQDLRILVEGEDVPPPLTTFAQMKFTKG